MIDGHEREWQLLRERDQRVIATCALAGVRFEHRRTEQGFERWKAVLPDGGCIVETNNINASARHALAVIEEDNYRGGN